MSLKEMLPHESSSEDGTRAKCDVTRLHGKDGSLGGEGVLVRSNVEQGITASVQRGYMETSGGMSELGKFRFCKSFVYIIAIHMVYCGLYIIS